MLSQGKTTSSILPAKVPRSGAMGMTRLILTSGSTCIMTVIFVEVNVGMSPVKHIASCLPLGLQDTIKEKDKFKSKMNMKINYKNNILLYLLGFFKI